MIQIYETYAKIFGEDEFKLEPKFGKKLETKFGTQIEPNIIAKNQKLAKN